MKKPFFSYIFLTLWIVFLFIPATGFFFFYKTESDIFQSRSNFESSFNKNYSTREQAIKLYSDIIYHGFNTIPFPQVVRGDDDFLFSKASVQAHCHEKLYTQQELSRLIKTLTSNAKKAELKSLTYIPIFIPSKVMNYQDKLPKGLDCYPTETRLSQASISLLESKNIQHNFIAIDNLYSNITDEYLALHGPTFYRTDHHLTNSGEWLLYQNIISYLTKESTAHIPFSDLKVSKIRFQGGSLARLLNLSNLNEESIILSIPKKKDYSLSKILPVSLVYNSDIKRNLLEPLIAQHAQIVNNFEQPQLNIQNIIADMTHKPHAEKQLILHVIRLRESGYNL